MIHLTPKTLASVLLAISQMACGSAFAQDVPRDSGTRLAIPGIYIIGGKKVIR